MEQEKKPRMLLQMRNSSKRQATKIQTIDGRVEYDIPLQRSILRPWAESLGYEIVGELVEGGISGFKLSSDQRDAVVELKAMADRGEFDVLGIYMSDRLGRIADETPLIVSYLNARGIKVLSYTDGFISTETHEDKFMTYFRFWMAEGESIKTSKRVRDAHEQMVEQGKWRAGSVPYGYKTVSKGSLNGKGRPIFDIEIVPNEAETIKRIFRLYLEHYSSKTIAKMLNDEGIPTQKNTLWSCATINCILRNKQYIGIYELGKTLGKVRLESPVMEYLRIIDDVTFAKVQEIKRKNKPKMVNGKRPTVRGSKLLTGLLYCECGEKYTSQTQISRQARVDGSVLVREHNTYRCNSYRHPKEGQCRQKNFNVEKLDKAIIDDAKKFLLETDIEKLLNNLKDVIREKEVQLTAMLQKVTKEKSQIEKELAKLKEEVYKAIIGESQFPQGLLSELIQSKEKELLEINNRYEETLARAAELNAELEKRKAISDDLSNWAEKFDMQSTMEKKSMLINLINKITIYSDEIEVRYSISFDNIEEKEYNDEISESEQNDDQNGVFLYPKVVQRDTRLKALCII